MEITVHDITLKPCWCEHESKWRNGGDVFLVVKSIKSCIFADEGRCLWCAHASKNTWFFQIDARAVLLARMMEISRGWDRDMPYDILARSALYKLKHFLDTLKRRACGWFQNGDKTPEQILNADEIQNLPDSDQLKSHFYAVIVLADKVPKQKKKRETFDRLHFATDQIICDRMSPILTRVQSLTPKK